MYPCSIVFYIKMNTPNNYRTYVRLFCTLIFIFMHVKICMVILIYLCTFYSDFTLTKQAEFPEPAVYYWYSVNYQDSNYSYERLFGLRLQILTFQDRRHNRRSVASSVDTESQKDNYDTDKSDNPDSRSESKRN